MSRPHGVARAWGRDPQAALFGEHWRDWPRKWVQRICKAAGVPKVTAHGMRRLHGTLAVDSGITATEKIPKCFRGAELDRTVGLLNAECAPTRLIAE